MKTLSDRRCEPHLFAGFERVILSEVSDDEAREAVAAVAEVYGRHKLAEPNCDNPPFLRVHRLWKYGTNAMIEW
jgi:hypothetical protein